MIFDIKTEDLQRKSRVAAGGHMTDVPLTITYAKFVSYETVKISFTMIALNDSSVKNSNIMNAYIKTPYGEKVYTILGPEFVPYEWKMAIIIISLYGLKSVGASFQNYLVKCMQFMGYNPCLYNLICGCG